MMDTTRREFLHLSAAGSILGLGLALPMAAGRPQDTRPGASLKILMLGGTGFLGPHTVEAALARGHEVTLFNRGRTNPDLFPELERLRGNRDPNIGEGLKALLGRTWDAVIDTSGYVPRVVKASADLLAGSVQHYVFISSISVYDDFSDPGMDESWPVGSMPDETNEDVGKFYGPLKALCEQAAERAMPGRVSNIRPGLIVGPGDISDRFTYWPVRIERGGEVLAPGTPDDPVQYIDVRDLAAWIILAVENRAAGVFNATGPEAPTNIAELLYGCKAVTGGNASFTWVDADFLEAHGVQGWVDLPVWVAPRGSHAGFGSIDCSKAIAAGLTFRPLARTAHDTLEWFKTLPKTRRQRLGMRGRGLGPAREQEVLAAWHARSGSP